MSNVLEITKEKVLEASKECPEAKRIFEKLFPSVFEGGAGWVDITKQIKWTHRTDGDNGFGILLLWYDSCIVGHLGVNGDFFGIDDKYKIEKDSIYFRILKKDGS